MENALLIAKIGGVFYLAIGLGVLFNPKFMSKVMDDYTKNMGLTLISARVLIIIGMLVTLSYNVWARNRMLIITIIGWIALVKGVTLLLFPNGMLKFGTKVVKNTNTFIIIFSLIFGLVLTYFGYFS